MLAFYSLYEQCEQAVDNSENWLKVQQPPASEPEPLKVQLDRCRVREPGLPIIHRYMSVFTIYFFYLIFFFFSQYSYYVFIYLVCVSFHASVCLSTFL